MLKKIKVLPDKWLIFPIVTLLLALVIKLWWFKKIILNNYFYADLSVHASNLFFLLNFGFHQIIPYWYNGMYKLFEAYPPGWFYLALPGYILTKNVIVASIIAVIITFGLGLAYLFVLGKTQKFTTIKIIAFFSFFYANALILNTIFDVARFPDLLAWTQFILLSTLIFYYRKKILDFKFYILLIILLSVQILCHIWSTLMFIILLFSFMIGRNLKEKGLIIISAAIPLLITSFWWIPFLKIVSKGISQFKYGKEILSPESIISFNTVILISFLVIFYFYYLSNDRSQSELKFFLPLIVLNLLILTRLVVLIPIFNKIPINSFNYFFLFLTLFLFFKIKFTIFPKWIRISLPFILVGISLASVTLTFGYFGHSSDYLPIEKDMIELLPNIEGKYLVLGNLDLLMEGYPVIAKGTIDYHLVAATGSYYHGAPEVNDKFLSINRFLQTSNCTHLKKELESLGASEVLSHDYYCVTLEECGLEEKFSHGQACIMVQS